MSDLPSTDSPDYNSSLSSHGESPQSLKWASYRAAAQRYRQLLNDLNIEGKSVLDAGCGMGDLLPYLYSKSDKFDYLGVDKTAGFIDIAKKRYLGHKFEVGDPFDESFTKQFDIVLCSGVMNANAPDWQQERQKMITQLFSLAKESLAFNMAGGLMQPYIEKNIAYANSRQIFDFCATLTPKLILKNHYHSHDFTVAMFKPKPAIP
jgi:SAM-dependent methyltransferase